MSSPSPRAGSAVFVRPVLAGGTHSRAPKLVLICGGCTDCAPYTTAMLRSGCGLVNLMALLRRLIRICVSRDVSHRT